MCDYLSNNSETDENSIKLQNRRQLARIPLKFKDNGYSPVVTTPYSNGKLSIDSGYCSTTYNYGSSNMLPRQKRMTISGLLSGCSSTTTNNQNNSELYRTGSPSLHEDNTATAVHTLLRPDERNPSYRQEMQHKPTHRDFRRSPQPQYHENSENYPLSSFSPISKDTYQTQQQVMAMTPNVISRQVIHNSQGNKRVPESHQTMYRHFTMLYECNTCRSIYRSFELFSQHKITSCFDKRTPTPTTLHHQGSNNSLQLSQYNNQPVYSAKGSNNRVISDENLQYLSPRYYSNNNIPTTHVSQPRQSNGSSSSAEILTNPTVLVDHEGGTSPKMQKIDMQSSQNFENVAKSIEGSNNMNFNQECAENSDTKKFPINSSKLKCMFCDKYFNRLYTAKCHLEMLHEYVVPKKDWSKLLREKLRTGDQRKIIEQTDDKNKESKLEEAQTSEADSETKSSVQIDENEQSDDEVEEVALEVYEE